MKKILVLTTISHGGGAERLILDQIKYHNKKKFDLTLIALKEGNIEDEFKEECKKNNVEYFNFKSSNIIKAGFKIKKIMDQKNINLIHCNLYHAELISLILKIMRPRTKVIISKHGTNFFRKKMLFRVIGFFTSKCATKIICVSKAVKNFVKKYEFANHNKNIVIYNGIDLTNFKKIKVNRKKDKLNYKDFVVGIVGRIEQPKGHIYLIKAIKNLKNKISNLKLIIVGTGYLEKDLKKIVNKYKIKENVKFLGFRRDINYCYNLMDVFCLPSVYEGFGLVVAEAMATKTPVIVSRIDGIKEVVTEDEGILIEPKNVKAIENAILEIYNNKEKTKKLVKKAKERAKKFDIKENIKNVEKVYGKII